MGVRSVFGLLAVAIAPGVARGDLVSHAAAGYGDGTLTGPEQYGTIWAVAQTQYPGATLHGEAWAQYGRLAATASVEADPGAYAVSRAVGEAGFSDTLNVAGPRGAGFIVYTFSIDGHAAGDADLHLFLHQADFDEELAGEVSAPAEFSSLPHRITFGQPFPISASILVLASVGLGESGMSSADFSSGAALTGIDVYDDHMTRLEGWSLGSQSGTQYPVPAPATPAVLVAAAALVRRRRWHPHAR
jgi:uncharacterized protein (TIGR03382 family)